MCNDQLLEKDKSVAIHTTNLQYLVTQFFKFLIEKSRPGFSTVKLALFKTRD